MARKKKQPKIKDGGGFYKFTPDTTFTHRLKTFKAGVTYELSPWLYREIMNPSTPEDADTNIELKN